MVASTFCLVTILGNSLQASCHSQEADHRRFPDTNHEHPSRVPINGPGDREANEGVMRDAPSNLGFSSIRESERRKERHKVSNPLFRHARG